MEGFTGRMLSFPVKGSSSSEPRSVFSFMDRVEAISFPDAPLLIQGGVVNLGVDT